jgi:rod shape-determining protein MreC
MALYSRPRTTRLLVVSLVMLSLVTITVDYRGGQNGPLELVGKGALSVVGALQGAVSRVARPVGNFFSGLAHVGSLTSENRRLKDQLREFQIKSSEVTRLRHQVEEYEKLLKIEKRLSFRRTLTAHVIGASVGNFQWTINIDKGSADGIKMDMPVISGDGLVGHAITVAPHVTVVQLIVDPDSAVAGRLASSGETGLVLGQRNRPLSMDLVNPNANVAANEQVVTSGYRVGSERGLYPPGIPIGFVSHIYTRPGSLTKTIELTPAADFSALEVVAVVVRS